MSAKAVPVDVEWMYAEPMTQDEDGSASL